MTKRTYTAADIRELVEMCRHNPDISAEKFSGMEFVASLCRQLETMTKADMEQEVKRLFARV